MKMVDLDEEDFPRGGTRARVTVKRPKRDDNLFSTTVQPKAKKQRKEKRTEKETLTEDDFHSSLKIQGTLTYNSLRTDMVILGCIRHVTNFSLEIELPGLTFGTVTITNISDPLTKYLNQKLDQNDEEGSTYLSKLFKVGQFVLTKVTNIGSNDKGVQVDCTINPREIYSDKFHNSFEKGLLVWAAVQSELEHGYEMNIGVKNCRIFLPSKNIDKDKTLSLGELTWCTIHKSDSSNAATTLRVSCKSEHLKKSKIDHIKSLHDLLPGMQVEMVVEKITNNGIHGKFLNIFHGYIDEGQLNKKLSEYQEGKLINAFVLYVDHTIKVTYLTIYDLDLVPSPKYKVGDVVVAQVTNKTHNGVQFKLPSKEKCFVTNRRLLLSLPKQYANLDISDTIRLKFAPGSRHTCRILDYNRLSRIYIGTVEVALIKEKLFTASDVQLGQLLEVTVEKVKPDGLVVSSGHIRGFVSNFYLSNIKYSENIKKKFKEGLRLKARVLNKTEDGNILLTLKSQQVDSENCLTDLSQAKRGDRYAGVIIQTKPAGALVNFYGNVQGWISRKYLGDRDDDQKPDPQLFFYLGQVVNPWILGIAQDRLRLSVQQPKDFDTFGSLAVGQKIKGVVSSIRKDKLFVKTLRGRPIGVVPVNHLCGSLSLCSAMFKTYSVGDKINDLICIDNSTSPNILSRREALVLKRTPNFKLKKFEQLRTGTLIRCSYISDCESGIYVSPLILDRPQKILIKKTDIVNEGVELPKFEMHQGIMAKVIHVEDKSKKIRLSAKLTQVFDNSVEKVISLFSQHLSDVQTLRTLGKEKNWEICQYDPGERVSCYVEKLGDQGGCLVSLPNGVNGLVAPKLCPTNIKQGDTVTGVFISQNFAENYAEICLRSDISMRINKTQDGVINCSNLSSCIAETVLNKSYFSIASLKNKDCNRQLIYLPLYLHENDFEGCRKFYQQDKFKLCICAKTGDSLIGMSKKLFLTLDKKKDTMLKAQLLRTAEKNEKLGKEEITRATVSPQKLLKEDKASEEQEEMISDDSTETEVEEDIQNGGEESEESDDVSEDEEDIENGGEDLEESDDVSEDEEDVENGGEELEESDDVSEDEDGIENDSEQLEGSDDVSEDEEDVENGGEESMESDDVKEDEEVDESDDELSSMEEEDEDTGKLEKTTEETVGNRSKNISFGKNSINTFSSEDSITGPLPVVSSMSSFFSTATKDVQDVSSDDEVQETAVKKKKKLTPAERAQLAREEEERITRIEKELADSTKTPESAEQFDRSVIANPNSSELWTQYIAFHAAATEFDKARAVAKRALEAINVTLVDERLNIWIALLNLENMVGTKESFDKTFEDAVKYNDSLQVYLKTIQMLAESGKIADMEEKIKKAKNKYKQEMQMWTEIAKTYYQLGKFKEARNIKDSAIKSTVNRKMQLELIVKFALMEFKLGDADHGAAIFETMLSSDPKKVTIWTTYVDQLVKKNKIDEARQVLERSVSQRLPLKNMKTLFLKFRMFEEQHGTLETAERVKEMAKEFASKVL